MDASYIYICFYCVCVCAKTVDSEPNKQSLSVTSDAATTAPQAEFYAVLDTGQSKRPKTPLPISGPELAARLKIGTRVVRGVDWKWGDQVKLIVCQFFNVYFCCMHFLAVLTVF